MTWSADVRQTDAVDDPLRETQELADRLAASEWPEHRAIAADLHELIHAHRHGPVDAHAGADQPL